MSRYSLVPLVGAELLRARLKLAATPKRKTLSLIETGGAEVDPATLSARDRAWLDDLRWAIVGSAARLPFRTDCIVRVIAGRRLLRRRGLEGRTEIQVGRCPDGAFEAHVWLECAGQRLTGGPNDALSTFPAEALMQAPGEHER